MKVLLVEDQASLNKILVKHLKNEGYIVEATDNGIDGEEYILSGQYDAIMLDIMLPGKEGLDILKDMRERGDMTPVILITAKDQVDDKVKGLDTGADDYLVKPFAIEELFARLRSLTRRPVQNARVGNIYKEGTLTLNTDTHVVKRGDNVINLSRKEYIILEYMIRNKGIVLSRDQIWENSWDASFEGESNMVDVYIRYLRKKIDDGYDDKLIHTVRGSGYVLRANEE